MDSRSEENLKGVHPDLVKVVRAVWAKRQDFMVIDGLRTAAEEAHNVATGASTTSHSRHLPNKQGLACAIDFAALEGGHITWNASDYKPIADSFKAAATALSVPIEWGGDWLHFKDLGHVQLPWAKYP